MALDKDRDGRLSAAEAAAGLLPEDFSATDANRDGFLSQAELTASIDRVADRLPNLAIPEMNGSGAQEICVTTSLGLCDFISAMDTARQLEWNCWYHILNCGYPLKVSGETDFPCMSSTRVGQGRVYVQMGRVDAVNFPAWCEALAHGRSYVSDGYAHALQFSVADQTSGGEVALAQPGKVTVKARVAFAKETPLEVPYGGVMPAGGPRLVGDTVVLHEPRRGEPPPVQGEKRLIEVVVNGRPVASQTVPADDQPHDLVFDVPINGSSWVALRHFPQLHTNPVNVIVGGKPIRASRASALWCAGTIEQLWQARGKMIKPHERDEAQQTFQKAIENYHQLANEAPLGT